MSTWRARKRCNGGASRRLRSLHCLHSCHAPRYSAASGARTHAGLCAAQSPVRTTLSDGHNATRMSISPARRTLSYSRIGARPRAVHMHSMRRAAAGACRRLAAAAPSDASAAAAASPPLPPWARQLHAAAAQCAQGTRRPIAPYCCSATAACARADASLRRCFRSCACDCRRASSRCAGGHERPAGAAGAAAGRLRPPGVRAAAQDGQSTGCHLQPGARAFAPPCARAAAQRARAALRVFLTLVPALRRRSSTSTRC